MRRSTPGPNSCNKSAPDLEVRVISARPISDQQLTSQSEYTHANGARQIRTPDRFTRSLIDLPKTDYSRDQGLIWSIRFNESATHFIYVILFLLINNSHLLGVQISDLLRTETHIVRLIDKPAQNRRFPDKIMKEGLWLDVRTWAS